MPSLRGKTILGFGFARFIFVLAAAPALVVCGLLTKQVWYEILQSVYSVVTLMYLAEGRRAGCACGMFYCLAYGALFFSRQTYGLAVFNTFFGFPVYLASLIAWGRHKQGSTVAMKRLSGKGWLLALGVSACVFTGVYFLLRNFQASNAVFDSLSLSFVAPGLVLLLLRYVENWHFNLAGNFVVLLLWLVNTAQDIANLNFVLIAALAVTVNAIGLVTWSRLAARGGEAGA